jgi:hypothetical protein
MNNSIQVKWWFQWHSARMAVDRGDTTLASFLGWKSFSPHHTSCRFASLLDGTAQRSGPSFFGWSSFISHNISCRFTSLLDSMAQRSGICLLAFLPIRPKLCSSEVLPAPTGVLQEALRRWPCWSRHVCALVSNRDGSKRSCSKRIDSTWNVNCTLTSS